MIDKEEYQNVIRAAYSLCQQIYDMELAGAIVTATLRKHQIGNMIYNGPYSDSKDPLGIEIEEELDLLNALLEAKNYFPQTFLEGCKNAPTTKEIKFLTQYPGNIIPINPSQT